MIHVKFGLNDEPVDVEVPEDELLLDTLRERLGTTSVRYSCGIGVCGTCTVMLEGKVVSSCLQLTQMAAGCQVHTAEAVLTENGRRRDVYESFVASRAFQCSYCIPPMALTVAALIDAHPDITSEELREQLGGNICRCGSYPQVLEAIASLVSSEETR
ncbi:(2Fe-2S)-binding protein [Mycobacterium sp. NPDC003449]